MRRSLAALWSSAALAVTVLGACLVALYWVFLVPIYQSPDEIVLIDYIFSVHQAGHLFTARDGPGATTGPASAATPRTPTTFQLRHTPNSLILRSNPT